MLSKLVLGVAGVASGAVPLRLGNNNPGQPFAFSPQEEGFLDELQRASFLLFWENAHPVTGLVKDRVSPGDNELNSVSSIAATGFGLTALCIGDKRGWVSKAAARARALETLRFVANQMPHQHGFFYHFVNWRDGGRAWLSEVSSIDSAILLSGVLTCRQHFNDAEIQDLAGTIYDRMDWQWMYRNGPFLSHGWTPERGFLASQWDSYSEHMMLYLLGIGANRNAITAESWNAWSRPRMHHGGESYIEVEAPLFIHQYSHAWFDFRERHDAHADYFKNSVIATRAHRQFCVELADEFPHYDKDLWGITASDSMHGYVIWGGPPRHGPIDGTVVPCAAGGSLPFAPQVTMTALLRAKEQFGRRIWGRYGFADAFNPGNSWVAKDFVAINTGITLLMAENARTGFVWDTFMRNPEVRAAMKLTGFSSNQFMA